MRGSAKLISNGAANMSKAAEILDELVNLDLMKNPVNWLTITLIATIGAVAIDLVRRNIHNKGDE